MRDQAALFPSLHLPLRKPPAVKRLHLHRRGASLGVLHPPRRHVARRSTAAVERLHRSGRAVRHPLAGLTDRSLPLLQLAPSHVSRPGLGLHGSHTCLFGCLCLRSGGGARLGCRLLCCPRPRPGLGRRVHRGCRVPRLVGRLALPLGHVYVVLLDQERLSRTDRGLGRHVGG